MNIFIGSSTEAKSIANVVAIKLEDLNHKPFPWYDMDELVSGEYFMDVFEEISKKVDAAIFIFAKDDKLEKVAKGNKKFVVRNNVVLEYGFFVAKLGRQNVAILRDEETEAVSDINGIIYIPYNEDKKQTMNDKLKNWINKIEKLKNETEKQFEENISQKQESNEDFSDSKNINFTFYGSSYFSKNYADFMACVIKNLIEKYPNKIDKILQSSIVSKEKENSAYFRATKIVTVGSDTYYIATSTSTDVKLTQLKNIFLSLGINPTKDIISVNGNVL